MVHYSFADQARALERAAARGLAYEADDKLRDMRRAFDDAVMGLRGVNEVIGSQPWLEDAVAKLIDAATDLQLSCERDMRDIIVPLSLDLSDAHALLRELEK